MSITRTYSPLTPQNPTKILQEDPCDTWRIHTQQLLTAHSTFASGWQTFKYGTLGEVIENIRTFALPFENQTYTFRMQYEYDPFNRIQSMLYPDSERVEYGYNLGGMLTKVTGTVTRKTSDLVVPVLLQGGGLLQGGDGVQGLGPGGDHAVENTVTIRYPYLDSIVYNQFELRDSVVYGNGTQVRYVYDSLLRLVTLRSYTADGERMQDIAYTYDSVGNILRIENAAGMLTNGLGGTYSSNYEYDDLYRLTGANGWWYGEVMSYQMQMEYHPNGRIQRKQLNALSYEQTGTSSSTQTILYDNFYHYNNLQPNTLAYVDNNNSYQQFGWDARGNLTEHFNGSFNRRLCWDEQNRLLGVKDEGLRLSHYLYDAGGDRVYKNTGEYTVQNQSGQWHSYYHLSRPTLYASPYLVSNERGYTKHYYAESERIASRIGGGGLQEIGRDKKEHMELFLSHQGRLGDLFETLASCLDAEVRPAENGLKHLYNWRDSVQPETDCYWYHPDHLGSASWITNIYGRTIQHLYYLPWGEDFVNQRTSSFSSMFTFSAKEKDAETGYSYFGARYYSSDLSVWLSVDPMAAKYPSLSPYVYCADNPVRLVDPNGEEVFIYGKAKRAFFREVKKGAKEFGISVKMDRFGKLSAKYNGKGPISKYGQLLLNAIEDRTIKINIEAIENKSGTFTDYMFGGFFGGNVLIPKNDDGTWSFQLAIAKQTVIPSDLIILDYNYEKPGQTSLHEITEAYNGAVIALDETIFSSEKGKMNPLYAPAHSSAIPQSGIVKLGLFDENGNYVNDWDAFEGKGYLEWQTEKRELLKTSDINTDDLNTIFK